MQIYHLTREEIERRRKYYADPTDEEIAEARRINAELDELMTRSHGITILPPLRVNFHIPTFQEHKDRVAEWEKAHPKSEHGKWDLAARVRELRREKLSVVDPWD